MTTAKQQWVWTLGTSQRAAGAVLALLIVLVLMCTQSATAQTLNIIHNFTGLNDGAYPTSGLTEDKSGNFYGTTLNGGAGYGTVFELKHAGNGWILLQLYAFKGGNDGAGPVGRVTIAPNGTLYGTTESGGTGSCQVQGYTGCGTVFSLKPPASACHAVSCPWTENVLYSFKGDGDASFPVSEVVLDQSGNLIGTTQGGGSSGYGTIYKLTPSGGGWTESLVYSYPGFPGLQNDYSSPTVIFDQMGNLYGTTDAGGADNQGTVFELTPSGDVNILVNFKADGSIGTTPESGVIADSFGNLYGATNNTGPNGGGVVFELMPSNGGWTFSVLYGLSGSSDYGGPVDKLTMDNTGNLYGTTKSDSLYGYGSIFKLTHSGDMWTYQSLHDFAGPPNDGAGPYTNLLFDASGNLWGTTARGGSYDAGTIFELTQPF